MRFIRTWSLLLLLALAACGQVHEGSELFPGTPPVLGRIAVLGASVSAGFQLVDGRGEPVDFAELLQRAVRVETPPIRSGAPLLLFRDPEALGAEAVESLLAERPTVLFAPDFLFWFGYGVFASEVERVQRFEAGLALLDRFECPIVVGDLPDMSMALEADVRFLAEAQVPDEEALTRLNARLAEWAAERPHVHVLPLAAFVARVRAGGPIELHGNRWEDAAEELLQPDLLHPTVAGTLALVVLAADTLDRARDDVTADMFRWDVREMSAEVLPPVGEGGESEGAAAAR